MYKTTFFEKNPEALTDMNNIISANPDTWPDILRNKYGIIVDEHFWENNRLLSFGSGVDIHKWIGKLPKPKAGWTPGKYKYMGPYNPLEKQLSYNPETGEVTEWKVKPYNKVDEKAAYHVFFFMIWEKTKVIVIERWYNHWIRFPMVKCQSGEQQHDS